VSEGLQLFTQNLPVLSILAPIYPIICLEHTYIGKLYEKQLFEDQMSRNYSSTIVAVVVVLFKFSVIRNGSFYDDWRLAPIFTTSALNHMLWPHGFTCLESTSYAAINTNNSAYSNM
jgi:hypothetical protein